MRKAVFYFGKSPDFRRERLSGKNEAFFCADAELRMEEIVSKKSKMSEILSELALKMRKNEIGKEKDRKRVFERRSRRFRIGTDKKDGPAPLKGQRRKG